MTILNTTKPAQNLIDARARLCDGKELGVHQISLLARHACMTRDMQSYVTLMTQVEPRLRHHFQDNCSDAEFLRSTGKVFGNVNIFRKVQYRSLSGPVRAFEKIYRRGGADLNRVQWVARNLWGKLPCKMPRIIEIVHGRRFSVVLFEFEAFSPISPDGLIETLRDMNEFSLSHPSTSFDMILPSMRQLPILYQHRRKSLLANLEVAGVSESDLDTVERACMDTVHVFNHADLHRFNVGQNGMIYDWDCACFAPAAHDLGRAIASLRDFRRLIGLRDFIQNRLGRDVSKDPADIARIMFFYLVYAAKKRLGAQDEAALAPLRAIFASARRDLVSPDALN